MTLDVLLCGEVTEGAEVIDVGRATVCGEVMEGGVSADVTQSGPVSAQVVVDQGAPWCQARASVIIHSTMIGLMGISMTFLEKVLMIVAIICL